MVHKLFAYFISYLNIHTTYGGMEMLQTITIGSCVSIQGQLVRVLPNGKAVIRVDDREFAGTPVKRMPA